MFRLQSIILVLILSGIFSASGNTDKLLSRYIESFAIKVPKKIMGKGSKKYLFGEMLFEDKDLSLSKNISCKSCHDADLGTSDALPLSIGVGGLHMGLKSKQLDATLTPRSAPHLYNKGHESFRTMFWDGRVFYDDYEKTYETPEKGLNGDYPKFFNITSKIENVMAMQALFPIASTIEMRGKKYAHLSNLEVWNKVTEQIRSKNIYKEFISENFNIADIVNALSFYQKVEFQVNDTPFDKYIKGDLDSLSSIEKEGALLFMTKGRCTRCHNGVLLSNQAFQSVSVPQIGPGVSRDKNDEGRYLITKKEFHKYGFLTQPLRNVALTAPFMHNGSLENLKEVVKHYNNPFKSIDNYSVTALEKLYSGIFFDFIYVDKNPYRNFYRKESLAPMLKKPLGLSEKEQNKIVCFLKRSLTQEKYHKYLDFTECR